MPKGPFLLFLSLFTYVSAVSGGWGVHVTVCGEQLVGARSLPPPVGPRNERGLVGLGITCFPH